MGKTHYLPHHSVISKDKQTTKVRVVYDASARGISGTSLNNCLYSGPCLLKTVADILTRFRIYPYAITADIEKAFLMISMNPADRDAVRFLWYEDPISECPKLVTYRFTRVVFGVTCSPFLLQGTLNHHVGKYNEIYPDVCQKLSHSLYADDVNTGGYTLEETYDLYKKSKKIMKDGGFNLRKWHSNAKELLTEIQSTEATNSTTSDQKGSEIPLEILPQENIIESSHGHIKAENPENTMTEEDMSYAKAAIAEGVDSKMNGIKVLGINWDSSKDMFVFDLAKLAEIANELTPTKRNVLSIVAKLYDPLGLITPVTTPLKVFLQELFKRKLGWDEPLPEELSNQWKKVLSGFEHTTQISVPRFYFGENKTKPEKIELFGFCDSSESAYAAVVYARITENEKSEVCLVASKTRVAPFSQQTIPRLELLSCLILSRLINSVRDSLSPLCKTEIVQCWTDSITALFWIKGRNKEWKLFVENRVQEIRKLVPEPLWAHCPGKQNPAYIPTRWINPTKIVTNECWWKGPNWLQFNREAWPNQPQPSNEHPDCLTELKGSGRSVLTTLMISHDSNEKLLNLDAIVPSENFSSYRKLLNVTAYVVRFIQNCRNKSNPVIGDLSAEEVNCAENLWVKQMQSTVKPEKLLGLKQQLCTFKDESEILRCKGRLGNTALSFDKKYPILLPRYHNVTKLIILHCHDNVFHGGTNETLLQLRSKFWVIKGRQIVKKIIRPCVRCRRIQGQPYPTPKQNDLPQFRVVEKHAFSSVSVDFAGPLYIKSNGTDSKVYVALFTCATSRAVHLEIVEDLSSDSFIRCFQRFCSRRGIPQLVVSDNAKTFKSAQRMLVDLFALSEVRQYLATERIKWNYIIAKAPWWGGFYERLVRSVKSALKKCIGNAKLTYDELNTTIIRI